MKMKLSDCCWLRPSISKKKNIQSGKKQLFMNCHIVCENSRSTVVCRQYRKGGQTIFSQLEIAKNQKLLFLSILL